MALTSADVNNQSFSIDRKGYDVDEVDVFLERVATELDELHHSNNELRSQLRASRDAAEASPVIGSSNKDSYTQKDIDDRDKRIKELEAQITDQKKDDSAIAQALIIAQRSADEIVTNANDAADKLREDAEDEAQRILDKANNEKQRVMGEITKLEDDREASRSQYQDLLNDFIASAQDTLSDISAKSGRASRVGYNAAPVAGANPTARNAGVPAAVAAYTTPTNRATRTVVPAQVKPSAVEKDFSGFGDTDDDFDFDEID